MFIPVFLKEQPHPLNKLKSLHVNEEHQVSESWRLIPQAHYCIQSAGTACHSSGAVRQKKGQETASWDVGTEGREQVMVNGGNG